MSFPDVSEALEGLTETLYLETETQVVADYETTETTGTDLAFEGVLEPMKPQRLLLKPEGQRNWRWWELWTDLDIKINAVVIDPEGVRFRVTARIPWFNAGYYQYELTEATTPVTP
jgi:hypothetical protein